MAGRFYVYELRAGDVVQYVGKGSGKRLSVQIRKFGLSGRVVRWFDKEADAYAFEITHIAAVSPCLNKHPGGNGCRVKRKAQVRDKFYRLCDKLGTRVVAARMLLNFPHMCDPSKLDEIRRIAYG